MLSEQVNNDIPKYLISTILTSKHVNKILYDKEINNMRLPQQKHILKWENELNNENIEWDYIFSLPYKNTISTKLRAFQYKYLMRIIPNNSFHVQMQNKANQIYVIFVTWL